MRHIEQDQTQIEIVFRSPGKRSQTFHVNSVLGTEVRRLLKAKIAASQIEPDTDDDWIPAEEVLPELKNPVTRAAACLRGLRYRENMTQRKLAAKVGILPHHLSEMENSKRPISKAMAKKLAGALNGNWQTLM